MGKNIPTSDNSNVRFPKQAERFKALRERHNLTQDDLCKLINRDLKTYRKWEKGLERPDCEILVKLTEEYEVSSDYLLGLIDEKNHDIKFICEYTGLSEEAVNVLSCNPFAEYISIKLFSECLSSLLGNEAFRLCVGSVDYAKHCLVHCASALDDQNEDVLNSYIKAGNSGRVYSAMDAIKHCSDELRLSIFESSQLWSDMLESELHYKQILHEAEKRIRKYE